MKHLRKITIFALIALMAVFFTGCQQLFPEYFDVWNNSEKRGREKAEELISYINSKDVNGIKNMFSEKNRKEAGLENEIVEFLGHFPNGIPKYEIESFVGGEGSFDHGDVNFNIETVRIYLPEKRASSGDSDGAIFVTYTHIEHKHEDEVGVNKIIYSDWTDKNNYKDYECGKTWPKN